jgi:hypothetical protein
MLKILLIAAYLFILICLLMALWGAIKRVESVIERGVWQHDQYLAKLNQTVINSFDQQNKILLKVVEQIEKGE